MAALRWRSATSVLRSPRCTAPCGCPGMFSTWWTRWWWRGRRTTSPAATWPAWSGPTRSSWPRPSPLSTRAPPRTVPLFPRHRWDCGHHGDNWRTHYRTFFLISKVEPLSILNDFNNSSCVWCQYYKQQQQWKHINRVVMVPLSSLLVLNCPVCLWTLTELRRLPKCWAINCLAVMLINSEDTLHKGRMPQDLFCSSIRLESELKIPKWQMGLLLDHKTDFQEIKT